MENWCKAASPEQGENHALVISQQLWLKAQDQVSQQSSKERGEVSEASIPLAVGSLTIDFQSRKKSIFSLKVWSLVGQPCMSGACSTLVYVNSTNSVGYSDNKVKYEGTHL